MIFSTQREPVEEINAMTLQVGLVGTDGIVIASDRRLQKLERYSRSIATVSKFLRWGGGLCCWAGDSVSEYAANLLCKLDWAEIPRDKEAIRKQLQQVGDKAMDEMERLHGQGINSGASRTVIVACNGTLWLLEIQRPATIANSHSDRVVSGDLFSSVRMFLNLYAAGCENLPISKLTFLAANAVLMGGMENPSGIAGLEVVVIPAGGPPTFLTKEKEQALATMSASFSEQLRALLFQEF
jgi:hypothetical protein